VLDAPAPPVGDGLLAGLGLAAGDLALERLGEQPGDQHHDRQQDRGDGDRRDLEAGGGQPDRHQAGGDEPPAPGQLDALAGEADQGGQQRQRRGHRDRHDRGGADRQALHEADAHHQHAEQRDDHGRAREQDGPARRVERDRHRLAHGVPRVQLLAVAGDDQQGVVDADAQADHDAEERGEVGDRDHVAEQRDDRGAEADAEQGDAHRQAHRQHRAERQDQDDDGERQAEHLGRRLGELGEDEPAQLDVEALDVGRGVEDLVADLAGPGELDVLGHLDARVRDVARLGALAGDLAGALLGVRAVDARDVRELPDLVEQLGHRRLDLVGLDPVLGAEHDRARLAGALAAEVVLEDVEAGPRLDVGQVELVSEAVPGGAGRGTTEHEDRDPKPEHELPAVVAPRA
jgi:hypothetical protein